MGWGLSPYCVASASPFGLRTCCIPSQGPRWHWNEASHFCSFPENISQVQTRPGSKNGTPLRGRGTSNCTQINSDFLPPSLNTSARGLWVTVNTEGNRVGNRSNKIAWWSLRGSHKPPPFHQGCRRQSLCFDPQDSVPKIFFHSLGTRYDSIQMLYLKNKEVGTENHWSYFRPHLLDNNVF